MARSLRMPNVRLKVPRLPRTDEPYEDIFEEMSLQEHLEELRSRVVKTCLSIGVAFIAAIFLTRPLLKFIRDKAQADQGIDILSPTDPITVFMKVALYIAIGFALPIIIFQLVGFLAPGLTRREKRYLFMSLPFVSLLFVAGAAFGSLLAAPRAFKFLSGFMSDIFQWSPNGMEIISFYITLMIGMGIAFELPIVMLLLSTLNIVSWRRMVKFRKYAAMLILVAGAIITPTPDPFNMLFVSAPIFVLYEVGIIVSRIFGK